VSPTGRLKPTSHSKIVPSSTEDVLSTGARTSKKQVDKSSTLINVVTKSDNNMNPFDKKIKSLTHSNSERNFFN